MNEPRDAFRSGQVVAWQVIPVLIPHLNELVREFLDGSPQWVGFRLVKLIGSRGRLYSCTKLTLVQF